MKACEKKYNPEIILSAITTEKQTLQQIADKLKCSKFTVKKYMPELIRDRKIKEFKSKNNNTTGYQYAYTLHPVNEIKTETE
jgi:predicted transcriptional regulator